MASGNYLSWTVPKLKAALAAKGATVGGRKTVLIERLTSYDRNADFRSAPIENIPAPLSVGWPVEGYQQLQVHHKVFLPKLTMEQIQQYFIYRIAGDNQFTGDVKAIEKGKDMFHGNRVQATSILMKDSIYFTGIVSAAMKNKVSYNYKIKMDKQTGDPINSHCECPAGKGPHGTCKHLAAVLLMVEHFIQTGNVRVEKTCTENLQTFHKPKSSYQGIPVKAEDIPTKRKQSDTNLDDPRPAKYRGMPGYSDFVRNQIINYCSAKSEDLAYRYLIDKANIQVAVIDHSYTVLPFTEYWVDSSNQVNEDVIKEIEKSTRTQSGSKLWFEQRAWRLTASRFGEICKITYRRNINKLCKSLISTQHTLHNSALAHGKNYEAKAIKSFENLYNLKTSKAGFFICKSKPFLGASPDGLVNADGLVEIKCPYTGRQDKIIPGKHFKCLEYDNEGNITLKKTSNYYYQVQGQLYICERKFCYFVIYTFNDLFVQKIEIDEEYCTSSLIPKLELFYTKYFRPYISSSL